MMNKTYYLSVSYKAVSKKNCGVVCEGNTILILTEPFTYDDLMDILTNCAKENNSEEWKTPPIIVSISELSEGLYKQLSKRRK